MKRLSTCLFVTALSLSSALSSVHAAGVGVTAGRELVKRYADTVVSVELVVTLKVKAGDREMPPREQKVDVNGTVISADGLTVASLAEVDPQTAFEAMRMSAPGGGRVELLGADFKEVKLRLADGTEIPARFVLKDADLDLAFMAPDYDAPKREYPFVDLSKTVEGALLEEFYYVGRAPKVLQRVPMVRTTSVLAVVDKPRRFYLLTELGLGTPIFDAKGSVLGISLQHFANGRRTGMVVRPSEDVAEMAKQAATAQAAPRPETEPAATPSDAPATPAAEPSATN